MRRNRRYVTGDPFDHPLTVSYNFGLIDFGDGDAADAIRKPRDATHCRIQEIHVAVRETFNAVTTQAFVRVGTATSAAKFAELAMGAAAVTDGYGSYDDDAFEGKPDEIDLVAENISQLEVAFIAPTGGTPAGIGIPTIVIDWW